ncbi:hypothetical protein BKA70DRAFT_820711 [Coprinopsis sp. MPI-PUGE-AT-0042]|nr:hypothetical protein BKA70DRAFT_820711 [Coprinopsis sp. MPI-PUGE-AT-0042]
MSIQDAVWSAGPDEAVGVNQRALIDKILARYSAEFSVFRELLQNSDDARSTRVEIHFKSNTSGFRGAAGFVEDQRDILVDCWTFQNDGNAFGDQDWARLKKIAEGNPDEQKIGAFGVGFYSVFSVTNQPAVTSKNKCMEFYWKDNGDQLFVRSGLVSPEALTSWTIFRMPLPEPSVIPRPFDLIRFLSSSITFMTCIEEISVYLNDTILGKVSKFTGPPTPMTVPRGIRSSTKKKTMAFMGVGITAVHIHADVLEWVYSSCHEDEVQLVSGKSPQGAGQTHSGQSSGINLAIPNTLSTGEPPALDRIGSSINMTIFSAQKPPPEMRYDLLYTGFDEYEASTREDEKGWSSAGGIFQGLRADMEGHGASRVYIGHSTSQTTGIAGHMAARFIPTVEREAIDFENRVVSGWNMELLEVGGILSRAAYEHELGRIRQQWEEIIDLTDQDRRNIQEHLIKRAIHALKFFTFRRSTPSKRVSKTLEDAFFNCLSAFSIISCSGVMPSIEVCLPNKQLAEFLEHLVVLPDTYLSSAPEMVSNLKLRNLIHETVPDDMVVAQLLLGPLKELEAIACIRWWIEITKNQRLQDANTDQCRVSRERFLSATTLTLSGADRDRGSISLASVTHFIPEDSNIMTEGPYPDNVLPVNISSAFASDDLVSVFGWAELGVETWVGYISSMPHGPNEERFHLSTSAHWAEQVLDAIAQSWSSLTVEAREMIRKRLCALTCIPTTVGMMRPPDAYFPNVIALHDLPISRLPTSTTMDELLRYLGLRKHVELDMVLTRLFKTNEWATTDLVKYFTSIRSTLTDEEMQQLREIRVFPREGRPLGIPEVDSQHACARFTVGELYEPLAFFRKLDLPVIDWDQKVKWNAQSEEATLLRKIGLKTFPELGTLVQGCASNDVEVHEACFQYLLDHMSTHYTDYKAENFLTVPFLPSTRYGEAALATPHDAVAAQCWSDLGFHVLCPDLSMHSSLLQVREHPTSVQLVDLLSKSPPMRDEEAARMFAMVFTRISDFGKDELQALSDTPFVPARSAREKGGTIHLFPPSRCYLGSMEHPIYSGLFTYVNFEGPAYHFLKACGAKDEPSIDDIALALAEDPQHVYTLCGGYRQYSAELRNLAANTHAMAGETIARMRRSPMLLGIAKQADTYSEDQEDPTRVATHDLRAACEVVVVDDTVSYKLFEGDLITAPQEEDLERFYLLLGSFKLTGLINEEYHIHDELENEIQAGDTRSLVLERLALFLHEKRQATLKFPLSWLSSPNNFQVRVFTTLAVTKELQVGNRPRKRINISAVAPNRANPQGAIELWICRQVDLYEVALSMNRILFDAPKVSDALLFSTILATDLAVLERRGYNVTRILNQQQHISEAPMFRPPPLIKPRQRKERHGSHAPSNPVLPAPASVVSAHASTTVPKADGTDVPEEELSRHLPPKQVHLPQAMASSSDQAVRNPLRSFYRRMKDSMAPGTLSSKPSSPASSRSPTPSLPRGGSLNVSQSTASSSANAQNPTQALVSSKITLAINACTPELQTLLKNREQTKSTTEAGGKAYCYVSGENWDLKFLGQMEEFRIFISRAVPTAISDAFIKDNDQALARFIGVLAPLSKIFQLPEGSVQVFHDPNEGLVAFNRNGSLFVNFRHFQTRHDAQVQKGDMKHAYIAWYFALAHEIAHNLVEPHNSEHEFYFSTISETYLLALIVLLSA